MKIARKYHLETGNPGKHKIVSRWQSWHGNTVGALSMSGRSPWRRDYAPYLLDFPHIRPCYPYRCPSCRDECALTCAEDLERVILQEGADTIAAFIAEPILGTSCAGLTPPPDYFRTIREILRPPRRAHDRRRGRHRLRAHGPSTSGSTTSTWCPTSSPPARA